MAVVKNLMVRAGADFSAISKQAEKVKTAMSGMQKAVDKSCSLMSSTVGAVGKAFQRLGAMISVAAITSFAKSAKEAYDTQTEAEAKLAQVMRNTMDASDDEIRSIKDLTAAQQELGVIGDEVQLAGAQELATYATMTSTLETLIPVMNDMVAQQYGLSASGENAASIATMMGKVLEGQTSALSRYGYSFTAAQEAILKYGTEEQRAATLAEVVEQSVGGMNAALAATPSGRLQQVNNTLGDIKENFGRAVSTALTAFIPALNLVASVLASVATLANKVAQAIANVFGGGASSAAKTVSYTAAATGAMDDLTDSTKGAGNAAKSAGKAAESLSTYGFDTLQKLSGTSSSSGSGSGGSSGAGDGAGAGGGGLISETTDGADEAGETIGWLEAALSRLKQTAASLNFEPLFAAFERLKTAVEPLTQTFFSGLEWAYNNIFDPMAHWTVEEALPTFLDMLTESVNACVPALENLGRALQPLVIGAFEGLKWAYDNVFIPLGTWIGSELLPAFLNLLADAADVCAPALEALGQAVQPLVAAAFEGLKWAFDNVIIPLGAWAGGELLPAFLNLLATAASALSAAVEALSPAGQWLWDNFLQPIASWTGGVIVDVINALGDALSAVGDWISSHQTAVENIAVAIGTFAAVWTACNIAVGIWNGIGMIATAVTGAFAAAVAFLTSPITLVIGAIAALVAIVVLLVKNWDTVKAVAEAAWEGIKSAWNAACAWFDKTVVTPIKETFSAATTAIGNFFSNAWTTIQNVWSAVCGWFSNSVITPVQTAFSTATTAVGNFFSNAWTTIQNVWSAVCGWFSSTVITPVQTAFSTATTAIGNFFSDAWTSIKTVWSAVSGWFGSNVFAPISDGFKGFINGIISLFEGMVNAAIKGVNTIIQGLNKLSFDVPDWVPDIGGGKIGFNIPTVSTVSLPRLANGAVFEGNDPYLAVVNDQKYGTNVETPLATMIEAMMAALEAVGLGGGGNIQVDVRAVFEGQLAALARVLRPYIEADAKRVGNQASTVKGVV